MARCIAAYLAVRWVVLGEAEIEDVCRCAEDRVTDSIGERNGDEAWNR